MLSICKHTLYTSDKKDYVIFPCIKKYTVCTYKFMYIYNRSIFAWYSIVVTSLTKIEALAEWRMVCGSILG